MLGAEVIFTPILNQVLNLDRLYQSYHSIIITLKHKCLDLMCILKTRRSNLKRICNYHINNLNMICLNKR